MFKNDGRTEQELARIARDFAPRRGIAALVHGKPWRRVQWALQGVRYSYPHRNLFVAGLPKSGTTWLERCLTSVPGYRRWIPGYIPVTGQDLLPTTLTSDLPVGYTVTRVHTQPLPRNVQIVHATGRPYVVMVRDLRDVIVSYYYYAQNRDDVLLHDEASAQGMSEFIDTFAERLLGDYVNWCAGWLDALEAGRGMLVRYEDMLADLAGALTIILAHYEIDLPPGRIEAIARQRQFSSETGRRPGQEDQTSFNRKGVAGDWVGRFSPENIERFNAVAEDVMTRLGYDTNQGATA